MKKTSILSLLMIVALQAAIFAGGHTRYDKNVAQYDAGQSMSLYPINRNPVPSVFTFELAGAFSVDSITVGPEISTLLTGFDDYKTNGEPNHFMAVDPSDPNLLHACDVQTDSLDPAGATTRRVRYSYSTDAGLTWNNVIDVPDGRRSGFPTMDLLSGAAVIANHNIFPGSSLDAILYVDAAPQAESFTEYKYATVAPFGIWPQITAMDNGSVLMLSRRNVSSSADQETLYVAKWNGTTMGARSVFFTTPNTMNGSVGSNMQFGISSSGANVVAMAYPVNENDVLGNAIIYTRVSTDHGTTWGAITNTFTPTLVGADTIGAAGGATVFYKPGTSTWFLGYITAAGGTYASAKLYCKRSDGVTTMLTDAATVGATASFAKTMSFVFSIDNPVFGWSNDKKMLYCTYTVVKPDTGASGYNERDLYFQYSANDGTTWSAPVRLTNTTNIDEAYPSVSMWNKGSVAGGVTYELNMNYMKDPGVGPTTFGGSAPASRNVLVYRKISFGPPIGIHNEGSIANSFALEQNYPNPFNPSTKIYYSIPKQTLVNITVYDMLGRQVATLVNGVETAGVKSVNFDASNFASGIYFYTIRTAEFTDTKKMMLVK
jgi:hypothetical protein